MGFSVYGEFPLDTICIMEHIIGMFANHNHPFKRIAKALKPDERNRISITKILSEDDVLYDVYVNDLGQVMLDPVITIPACEAWVFKNKDVRESIERGLDESHQGKTKYLGSFAKYAKE